jgi:nitroimidazol reductase NimA-like FMN-containing flavoprotein (pyridoxamine 5'-phosphate oxidase superfamily)
MERFVPRALSLVRQTSRNERDAWRREGRQQMIGTLSPQEIDAILRRHRVGRLACSANDRPYVVPISYAYDGVDIYCYSAPGRKLEVMREQPLVCFEVDEILENTNWQSVVAEAQFEELTGGPAREAAITKLTCPGSDLVPRGLSNRADIVIFRLRLIERSGRFERRDA